MTCDDRLGVREKIFSSSWRELFIAYLPATVRLFNIWHASVVRGMVCCTCHEECYQRDQYNVCMDFKMKL